MIIAEVDLNQRWKPINTGYNKVF